MAAKLKPCPVCGRKTKNVVSHIRKMAMGEVHKWFGDYSNIQKKDKLNDLLNSSPHQVYIRDHSKPEFKYEEPA